VFVQRLTERVTERARDGMPPPLEGEKREAYGVLLSD
jgi:hypothetical protein